MNSVSHTCQSIQRKINETNAIIASSLRSDVSLLQQALSGQQEQRGKQVRPTLLIMCAECIQYHGQEDTKLAAIVEMLHLATLMHDDVIDEADIRRNRPTIRRTLGNKSSILTGDFYYATAFNLIASINNTAITQQIADATLTILNGEMRQWQNHQDQLICQPTYYQIINEKTAKLFELATSIVCLTEPEYQAYYPILRKYGNNLGIAFQIIDDLIDYTPYSGKQIGTDFYEKKVTLPILYLLEQTPPNEQQHIRDAFGRDLDYILSQLNRHNILEQCRLEANSILQTAITQLGFLPDKEATKRLIDYTQSIAKRSH